MEGSLDPTPGVLRYQSLNEYQMKYGAPKLEMYAAITFVKKFHSFLALRKFILRVDNQGE